MNIDLFKPIPPIKPVGEWKKLPIQPCNEPFVAMGPWSRYWQVATDAIYKGERRSSPYKFGQTKGALLTSFAREGVAKRLIYAASLLPPHHMLLVQDAYRTLEAQQSLFEDHVNPRIANGEDREFVLKDAQRVVSIPCGDTDKPSPHFTGGAIDLTIIAFAPPVGHKIADLNRRIAIRETANNMASLYRAEMERQELIRTQSTLLRMGTIFDKVAPQTATRYYEVLREHGDIETDEEMCLMNRRLLYNVMTAAGFSGYDEEWWHFDFGNQFHMARTRVQAIYGPIELSAENWDHEKMRLDHYIGNRMIHEGTHPQESGKMPNNHLYPLVKDVALKTGDLRHTTHEQAAII